MLIDEVKNALQGATPGPWWSHCDDDSYRFRVRQWTDPELRRADDNGQLICDTWPDLMSYQHEAWVRLSTPPFCPAYFDARLIALSPDMARKMIAAEEMADATEVVCDQVYNLVGGVSLQAVAALRAALTAYRKAGETHAD